MDQTNGAGLFLSIKDNAFGEEMVQGLVHIIGVEVLGDVILADGLGILVQGAVGEIPPAVFVHQVFRGAGHVLQKFVEKETRADQIAVRHRILPPVQDATMLEFYNKI